MTGRFLAQVDAVLADHEAGAPYRDPDMSDDAMRWSPDPLPEPVEDTEPFTAYPGPSGLYRDWDGQPIDVVAWALMHARGTHVADQTLHGVRVSTVWLGIDHSWGHGRPLIFETMTFAARRRDRNKHWHHGLQWRYSTVGDARRGHRRLVDMVRSRGVVALATAEQERWRPEPVEPMPLEICARPGCVVVLP